MLRIHEEFIHSVNQTSNGQAGDLWSEIEALYENSSRHYHTLAHLEHMVLELTSYKHAFASWNTIVFAIAYHDAVYSPLKGDNEEKSAALAEKRLTTIRVSGQERMQCRKLILATKEHEPADNETNLFTDADLSVLGAEPDRYKRYTEEVRREYNMYPDLLYKPGRKKVLKHFLGMPRIFKTPEFYSRYEDRARQNLHMEIEALKAG